jgi:hypothetical protein
MSGVAKYVEDLGHAQVTALQPGVVTGAHTCAFAFDVDTAAVQRTVDYFLNAPAGGAVRYSMLGPSVFLTFMHADRLSSGGQVTGWIPDAEAAFWVPLLAHGGDGQHGDRLVFWMPYIIIDNSEGMVTGREVWGFRKSLGTVTLPHDAADPAPYTATARLYRTFSSETEGEDALLLRLERQGPMDAAQEVWNGARDAIERFVSLWSGGAGHLPVHGLSLTFHALEQLLRGEVPMVNLKQFRDAADGTRACYQAIIESTCTTRKLYRAGLLPGEYALHITPAASHRIAEDLGLPAAPRSRFASWVLMDFTADAGREVWRAG